MGCTALHTVERHSHCSAAIRMDVTAPTDWPAWDCSQSHVYTPDTQHHVADLIHQPVVVLELSQWSM